MPGCWPCYCRRWWQKQQQRDSQKLSTMFQKHHFRYCLRMMTFSNASYWKTFFFFFSFLLLFPLGLCYCLCLCFVCFCVFFAVCFWLYRGKMESDKGSRNENTEKKWIKHRISQ